MTHETSEMIKVMKECHDELEVKDMTEQQPQYHDEIGELEALLAGGVGVSGDEKDDTKAIVDYEAVKTKHFTEYAGKSVAKSVKT